MLTKLMKYEFKAIGRIMLPLYGALIGFAFINKLFLAINSNDINMEFLNGIPNVITMMAYVATMVAVFVATIFVILQRFYKNLFGDEGYLMNTIPVKSWQNILSKLLVAMVWSILSFIIASISIIIMAYEPEMIKSILIEFKLLYSQLTGEISMIILEFIILGFVYLAHQIMVLYTSLSIGQLFNSKKLLGAFGGFIMICVIEQFIVAIGLTLFMPLLDNITINTNIFPQYILLPSIIGLLLFFGLLYYITNYILKNKLNLE